MTEIWPTPPTGARVRYYLVGSISEDFRAWARWDVKGPWFIVRRLGGVLIGLLIANLIVGLSGDLDRGYWVGVLIGALIVAAVFPALFGDLIRRRELARLEKHWNRESGRTRPNVVS